VRALRSYGLVFLVFALPFGLLTGLVLGVLDSASTGLRSGLVVGGLGGAAMALLLGTADVLGDREARSSESHGPGQLASVPVHNGPELPQRITAALQVLGGRLMDADVAAGRYTVRTRMTWRSFGERVTVQLTRGPRGSARAGLQRAGRGDDADRLRQGPPERAPGGGGAGGARSLDPFARSTAAGTAVAAAVGTLVGQSGSWTVFLWRSRVKLPQPRGDHHRR
jgi:hypothetical protein